MIRVRCVMSYDEGSRSSFRRSRTMTASYWARYTNVAETDSPVHNGLSRHAPYLHYSFWWFFTGKFLVDWWVRIALCAKRQRTLHSYELKSIFPTNDMAQVFTNQPVPLPSQIYHMVVLYIVSKEFEHCNGCFGPSIQIC